MVLTGTTSKTFVVAELKPALASVIDFPPPVALIVKSLKVTMPPTADLVTVPPKAPDHVAKLAVTDVVPFSKFPFASKMRAMMFWLSAVPTALVIGCWMS